MGQYILLEACRTRHMKNRLGPGHTGGARTGTSWVLGLIVLVARAVAPSVWTCPSLPRTSCAVSRLPSSTSSSPSQLSPNTQMELTKLLEGVAALPPSGLTQQCPFPDSPGHPPWHLFLQWDPGRSCPCLGTGSVCVTLPCQSS